jgi:hypothetical protein
LCSCRFLLLLEVPLLHELLLLLLLQHKEGHHRSHGGRASPAIPASVRRVGRLA